MLAVLEEGSRRDNGQTWLKSRSWLQSSGKVAVTDKNHTLSDESGVADTSSASAAGGYVLRLYVTGQTPRSVLAIANIRRICAKYLSHRHTLEIIDIYQHPEKCREQQIIAAPTLIKVLPHPLRRIIGDLSNTEKVRIGLDLPAILDAAAGPA